MDETQVSCAADCLEHPSDFAPIAIAAALGGETLRDALTELTALRYADGIDLSAGDRVGSPNFDWRTEAPRMQRLRWNEPDYEKCPSPRAREDLARRRDDCCSSKANKINTLIDK